MNKLEFLQNKSNEWFAQSNYGTDGRFIYRFDRGGKLVSKNPICDSWLTNWGQHNLEDIKIYI